MYERSPAKSPCRQSSTAWRIHGTAKTIPSPNASVPTRIETCTHGAARSPRWAQMGGGASVVAIGPPWHPAVASL